ncbi:MAG: tetratricopeptide repeat protein [Candidatus Zixiibacteriota bacterium]|nr:MAG: tetratricopeptide repeat protein [candidate division Zixibacteria bacterium]
MRRFMFAILLVGFLGGCSQEPQTVDELSRAGEEAFDNHEYARARKYLTKAVAQKPSDRHLLYLLGISYQRDFLYDSAFHYLKRLDLLFPGDREVNLRLYKIAKTVREWKSAIKAIQVLVETGDPGEQYHAELADLNLKVKNYKVAYYFYRKLLEADPNNPSYYLLIANLAAQLDSLDISLAVVDSALERFGDRDEFLVNKGLYLAAMKRYEESEATFRYLLAKDSSFLPARLNLAHALATQDDRAKKREALQLYLQLRPVADEVLRLDSLIGALREELNIKN